MQTSNLPAIFILELVNVTSKDLPAIKKETNKLAKWTKIYIGIWQNVLNRLKEQSNINVLEDFLSSSSSLNGFKRIQTF